MIYGDRNERRTSGWTRVNPLTVRFPSLSTDRRRARASLARHPLELPAPALRTHPISTPPVLSSLKPHWHIIIVHRTGTTICPAHPIHCQHSRLAAPSSAGERECVARVAQQAENTSIPSRYDVHFSIDDEGARLSLGEITRAETPSGSSPARMTVIYRS